MTTEEFHRKLTAILSADAQGYSRLMGDDEAATVKTLETYKGVMSSLIRQHRGRVVDSPGDNLLAEFMSVVDAVQCAVSIQKELQARNADLPENRKMEFRIGINLGDVIEEEDHIYGDGVNIAARLEALADPGGICISKTAFDHIESKLPLGYEFLGEQNVKNIAKPVGAYKVLMETRVVDAKIKRKTKAVAFWQRKSTLSLGSIVILAIAAVLYWNFYLRGLSVKRASTEPEQAPAVSEVVKAKKTIAVLPFTDLSPEKDQEYFVDGLTDEISTRLGQISKLKVTGMTSSFTFKGSNKTVQEISSLLGVENILIGSVRKAGEKIRITTKLLLGTDGSQLWSENYDRELKDVILVQEDIATAVANALKSTLGIDGSLKQLGGTDNEEAYQLYLVVKGRIWNDEGSIAILHDNLESLDAAIAIDPEFALAWAYKAQIYGRLAIIGPTSRLVTEVNAAINAAQRAIELEPQLGAAYYQLGFLEITKGEWIEAEAAYRKALELPAETLSGSQLFLPIFYENVGYFKKAQEILEEMRQYDPLNDQVRSWYVRNFGFLGDMQRAEEEHKRGTALFGDHWDDWDISFLRLGYGDIVSSDMVVNSDQIFDVAKKYPKSPKDGLNKLHKIYYDNNLSNYDLSMISCWAAYFGDLSFAMDAMEKAIRQNASGIFCVWLPHMKEVRQTSRFKELLREIGLVDYWNKSGWPDICHKLDNGDFVCD